jgi:hypothetical protein
MAFALNHIQMYCIKLRIPVTLYERTDIRSRDYLLQTANTDCIHAGNQKNMVLLVFSTQFLI